MSASLTPAAVARPPESRALTLGSRKVKDVALVWLKELLSPGLVALIVPSLLVAIWSCVTASDWVTPQLVPKPSLVFAVLADMTVSGELAMNLTSSFARVLWGFVGGAIAGLTLGWAMGLSPRLEQLLYPSTNAIAQVPALGLIPLAMMLLGIGESLKIVIVAKAVFVPVLIHAMRGVHSVPIGFIELAAVNEHDAASRLFRVILPASLRQVVTGLRLGLSQAWLALVTVELLASSEGIGYLMIRGRQLNQIDVVVGTAVVIGIVGFLLDVGVSQLERALPPFDGNAKSVSQNVSKDRVSFRGTIVPAFVLLIWSWGSRERWVDSRFLPSPWQCVKTFEELVRDGELLADVGWSLQRMATGLFWGVLLGIASGTMLGRLKWLSSLLMPSFSAFRQVTLVAWIPLLTLWVGQGEDAKTTFIALAVFTPLALSAFEGARSVPKSHLELAAVVEARPRLRLWTVTLPSALPHLWAGLELGLVYAWLATIAAEYFFRVAPGIGNAMVDGREHFRMDIVLCAVTVVGVMGFVLNRVACAARTRLLGWSR